jgi:hypothetical protein
LVRFRDEDARRAVDAAAEEAVTRARRLGTGCSPRNEKMATLGTLTAGGRARIEQSRGGDPPRRPSNCAKRSAGSSRCTCGWHPSEFTPERRQLLTELDQRARLQASQRTRMTPLERSDREHELEDWLEHRRATDALAWAPALAEQGLQVADLDRICKAFEGPSLGHGDRVGPPGCSRARAAL